MSLLHYYGMLQAWVQKHNENLLWVRIRLIYSPPRFTLVRKEIKDLLDAIGDMNFVKGLSAKIQQALRSSKTCLKMCPIRTFCTWLYSFKCIEMREDYQIQLIVNVFFSSTIRPLARRSLRSPSVGKLLTPSCSTMCRSDKWLSS